MRSTTTLASLTTLAALLCVFGAGCGPKKNEFPVTGKISVAGEPIPYGAIAFYAVDGATPVGGGTIKDGVYTANVPPGEKKITVTGNKITGQAPMDASMPGSPMVDQREDVVPAIYGQQSTTPLKATISGETKDLNFDLEKGEMVKPVF
jgi:hypothetical protein